MFIGIEPYYLPLFMSRNYFFVLEVLMKQNEGACTVCRVKNRDEKLLLLQTIISGHDKEALDRKKRLNLASTTQALEATRLVTKNALVL